MTDRRQELTSDQGHGPGAPPPGQPQPAGALDVGALRTAEPATELASTSTGAGPSKSGLRVAASSPSPTAALSALATQEHVENVIRLRRCATLGLFLWLSFSAVDGYVDAYVEPGTLQRLLTLRLLGVAIPCAALVRLYLQPTPSPRSLSLLSLLTFGVGSHAIGAMTIVYGGLDSPYYAGTLLTLVAHSACYAQPWRQGLVQTFVIASGYPAMAGLGILLSARSAEQWHNPATRAVFVLNCVFVVCVTGFAVFASHLTWALRRQIFESRSIGRYRLEQRIGAGGMGEVWAAYHLGLKRRVAVKLLRYGEHNASRAMARFEREVGATTQLAHPNTVRVFDFGVTEDGICYYAMELLEGEDLAALVAREGPLPPARAHHLLIQTARALAEAHQKGIHHRDLKPENLFITSDGLQGDFVKLLDFGIAKQLGDVAGVTATGAVVGTPNYISPEGACGRETDARSDVYSLGAVFYFALSGRPPFPGENVALLLLKHLTESAPELPMDVPPDIRAIVARCLHKNPEDRYRDAGELLLALGRCALTGAWQPGARISVLPSKPNRAQCAVTLPQG